ncbi:hypothetical protein Kole_0824 [Kosmotoga olearia TBF 19.5.1]|uniref:Uncharacterized protein n=1 Tax=Kosmotoga olearia (strain ATCC BAA-1733 / DSM 21960 / TBF 19.5.1) TaxID=521045 RepID=C5CG94_KOSOT|nr:hypothetical protein Kole_0824 [Kosmotoga olearia TBF 19.5.1]
MIGGDSSESGPPFIGLQLRRWYISDIQKMYEIMVGIDKMVKALQELR